MDGLGFVSLKTRETSVGARVPLEAHQTLMKARDLKSPPEPRGDSQRGAELKMPCFATGCALVNYVHVYRGAD